MYEMIEKRPDWLRLAPAFSGGVPHHRFSTARVAKKRLEDFKSAAQLS